MRHVILLMIALFVTASGANAQTAKDALNEFGLIGTWAIDCSKDPGLIGIIRINYSIPWFGNPKINLRTATRNMDADIDLVSRITEDKLK